MNGNNVLDTPLNLNSINMQSLKPKLNRIALAGEIRINTSSCDGCGKCVDICPNKVISLRDLSDAEIAELPFKGRVKVLFKGRRKAYVQNINACISCRLCEKNCHESAIQVGD